MVFESQLVLRRVYRVRGFGNHYIITYIQTTFLVYLLSSFLEKICDIRLFSRFLFFPIDVMVDFSDWLHNPFPKIRIKAIFLFISIALLTSSINGFFNGTSWIRVLWLVNNSRSKSVYSSMARSMSIWSL